MVGVVWTWLMEGNMVRLLSFIFNHSHYIPKPIHIVNQGLFIDLNDKLCSECYVH